MHISFTDSRKIISSVAEKQRDAVTSTEEVLAFDKAIGRVASKDVLSPISTPPFDSSAMDGYAVCSTQTTHVSPGMPMLLRVVGCVVAGDVPSKYESEVVDGIAPCVEIMTGAPFPRGVSNELHFDACLPYEHARNVAHKGSPTDDGRKLIQIDRPVAYNQHRRFAGNDFRRGDSVMKQGTTVAYKHVMGAASVGIKSVSVVRRIRVGVFSTGSELLSHTGSDYENIRSTIPDVNGPYLCSAIRGLGAEVCFIGSFSDDVDALLHQLRRSCASRSFDIIVSSGAVSAGKLDYIPKVVGALNGCVHFHHVALRPGHPVLFASLPTSTESRQSNGDAQRMACQPREETRQLYKCRTDAKMVSEVAFFGLPGNPIAAAACLRFLFVPYYTQLQGAFEEPGVPAKVILKPTKLDVASTSVLLSNPKRLDQFLLGSYRFKSGSISVELGMERSPAKIHPYLAADCWVHVPAHIVEVRAGDSLQSYRLSGPGLTM